MKSNIFKNKTFSIFILTLLLMAGIGLIPKNNSYIKIKYSVIEVGTAHLYINGAWNNPLKLNKNTGFETLKFGPINQDIKFLRFDPIDSKNSSVVISEISVEDNGQTIYTYDLSQNKNRRYEFVKSSKFDEVQNKLFVDSESSTPINIYFTEEVKLRTTKLNYIKSKIDNFLQPDKLILNILSTCLFILMIIYFNKLYQNRKILVIVFSISWFYVNLYLFRFLCKLAFNHHNSLIISNYREHLFKIISKQCITIPIKTLFQTMGT